MTESSKARPAQEKGPSQRITTRFLIEDPAAGWRTLSMDKANLVYRGDVQLPELAGRTVRVVYAQVSVVGRKVHELHGLTPSEWKFNREGWIDEEEKERLIRKHINSATGETAEAGSTTPQLTDGDVSAIRRCLKLPERGS